MNRLAILGGFFILLIAVSLSWAMLAGLSKFRIIASEMAIDSIPPTAPKLRIEDIHRGYGDIQLDSFKVNAPESRFGSIGLIVSGAKDDRTPADSLGYRFIHISGKLPIGFSLPNATYLAHIVGEEKHLWIYWDDGSTWNQDPIDFQIAVVAVDRGGNESPPSNAVRVFHDGDLTEYRRAYIMRAREDFRRSKAMIDSIRNVTHKP